MHLLYSNTPTNRLWNSLLIIVNIDHYRLVAAAKVNVFSNYRSLPSEDITIEAEPVLGQVETALEQNVPLQGTRVV